METIQIKSWVNGDVLFEHTQEGNSLSIAIGFGINAKANLQYADLRSAKLSSADLRYADLRYADLRYADLRYADLRSANLRNADLSFANLQDGSKCVPGRPIFQIGPIGSRESYLVAFLTDCGIRLHAGCFFGTKKEFVAQLKETHDNNAHAQEYKAALKLIDLHAKLWGAK